MVTNTYQRKWGWTYFIIGAVGIVTWSVATGTERDLSDTSGLWLNASLFLLLAAFVLEPWYSGSGTSIANSLLVGAGVVAAGFEHYVGWWVFLLIVSAIAFFSLAAASLMDSQLRAGTVARLERLGRALGSWRAVPFGLLVLPLVTFNQPIADEWTIGAATAVYCFGVSAIRPERFLRRLSAAENSRFEAIVAPPSEIVVIGELPVEFASSGSMLTVFTAHGSAGAIVVGPVVASGTASWRLFVPGARSILPPALMGDADVVLIGLKEANNNLSGSLLQYSDYLSDASCQILGTAVEGTAVAEMVLELAAEKSVSVGELFVTARDGRSIFWQIVDASTSSQGWPEGRRRSIRVSASQRLAVLTSVDLPPVAR